MKIRLADPSHRLSRDILGFARRLGVTNVIEYRSNYVSSETRSIIVVANGCPDNRVVFLLAYLFNGYRTIVLDIAFPMYKEVSIFEHLHKYVKQGYRHIIVIVDQEDKSLNEIYEYLERKIIGKLYVEAKQASGRLLQARLHVEPYNESTLLLVVNGLDDDRFMKHTIEDHLLVIAERLGITSIRENTDPKEKWQKLYREQQTRIYRWIIENKKTVREVFTQHTKALEILETQHQTY